MSCTEPNGFSQPAPVTLLTTTIALVQLNLACTSLTVATETHTPTLSTVFLQKHTQQFHPSPTLNSPEVPKSCCYFYSARFYSWTHTNTLAWACMQPACVSMQLQMRNGFSNMWQNKTDIMPEKSPCESSHTPLDHQRDIDLSRCLLDRWKSNMTCDWTLLQQSWHDGPLNTQQGF